MNNYRNETYNFNQLNGLMKLPNYQRPLVWSKDQKNRFIENISKGFPFGSLLLYKYENGEDFTLIDGQQRYTTLQEYTRKPELYFPLEDSPFVDELMKASGADQQSLDAQTQLTTKFISIIKELIRQEASGEEPNNTYLADEINAELPSVGQDTSRMMKIVNIQGEILKALKQYVDLDTLQIPCVIFTGEKSDLPEVFANVNLGGRKLTKYQVFAAQWDRYSVQLSDKEYSEDILNKTIERYERLTSDRGGLVIEDFSPDEMRTEQKITLPEFCHALGELIIEKCPACWPKKATENDDTVDTIGYNTLAIVFGVLPKELKDLPEKFATAGFEDNASAVEVLLSRIMAEYAEINGRFARFLKKPGIKEKYETSKSSSVLQFLSFFAALWMQRYGAITQTQFESIARYKQSGYDATCENLFPSFIYDMLTNQWKGSGDTRLGNYVTKTFDYLTPISKKRLHIAMSAYLDELKSSESINVDPITKTLLTIFASNQSTQYEKREYDYEHLIPRDTLNKRSNGVQIYKAYKIPGGGLGNIAFLDSSLNRAKGSKTLADAAGDLFSVDGSREVIDPQELRTANAKLLIGKPEEARALLQNRAQDIAARVIDAIC